MQRSASQRNFIRAIVVSSFLSFGDLTQGRLGFLHHSDRIVPVRRGVSTASPRISALNFGG
jgi:hypothetical protein